MIAARLALGASTGASRASQLQTSAAYDLTAQVHKASTERAIKGQSIIVLRYIDHFHPGGDPGSSMCEAPLGLV
jgi:hypothetical protein